MSKVIFDLPDSPEYVEPNSPNLRCSQTYPNLTTDLILKFRINVWEQRKLNDVVSQAKSYAFTRAIETTELTGFKYIHYGDIHTRVADKISDPSVLPNIKKKETIVIYLIMMLLLLTRLKTIKELLIQRFITS